MLRHTKPNIEPTLSLFETYINFVGGGNYEIIALIVFVLILLFGVWEIINDKSRIDSDKGYIDEGTALELLGVGAIALLGGLAWPAIVPLSFIAAIIGSLYKIGRRFKCRKSSSK